MTELYLTEQKLGSILSKIYTGCTIESQVKCALGRKKYDWMVKIPKSQHSKIPSTLREKFLISPDDVTIYYEYNGHYHYMTNSLASFEEPANTWVKIIDNVFLMAIPYWVQPDEVMSLRWFGVAKDFSEGFPHGFVSPKCVLPGGFCSAGDERFVLEFSTLPKEIQMDIVHSLISKVGGEECDLFTEVGKWTAKRMANAGSLWVWKKLNEILLEDEYSFLDRLNEFENEEHFLSSETDGQLVVRYLSNPMLMSIVENRYADPYKKEQVYERIIFWKMARDPGIDRHKLFDELQNIGLYNYYKSLEQ